MGALFQDTLADWPTWLDTDSLVTVSSWAGEDQEFFPREGEPADSA
jgi:hypothetical protein